MPVQHATGLAIGTAAIFANTALALSDVLAGDADKHAVRRYGPFGGGGFPFGGSGGGGDGDGGGYSGRNGNGFPGLFGAGLQSALHYRTIHGILASVAFVVLFPVGAVLMRIVPGRLAIWIHALFQLMAYILYIAGAAIGIYLVKTVNIPFAGGNLLSNPATSYHPILGLIVLAMLFLQPLLGYIHHVKFKQLGRRTIWSYLHLWNGRIGITIGIVNGGLGLRLANASHRTKAAYIAVAVILWSLWMLAAVVSEIRRARKTKTTGAARHSATRRSGHGRRRSHTPDPEMAGARAVGTPGSGRTHGGRWAKARQSHSSTSSNGSARR